ncbi:DUF805 domain-containing protein [Jannaschia sp.]|nr:DUF805 domain-containing protein [Jannaschia sp.]
MTFEHAVILCLRRYLDFDGRATGSEFWWFQFFVFLLLTFTAVLSSLSASLAGFLLLFVLAGCLVPSLAVAVRRMHDVGWSGMWLVAGICLPLLWVGLLLILVWKGQPGPNRFGPAPAGRAASRVSRIPLVPKP